MSDFKIYTNALKAFETDNGDRYVTGTTSSTIRDLHGDEMTLAALKSMEATAKQNMTIWLNHEYQVPDDLFGSVKDARTPDDGGGGPTGGGILLPLAAELPVVDNDNNRSAALVVGLEGVVAGAAIVEAELAAAATAISRVGT